MDIFDKIVKVFRNNDCIRLVKQTGTIISINGASFVNC